MIPGFWTIYQLLRDQGCSEYDDEHSPVVVEAPNKIWHRGHALSPSPE